MFWGLIMEPKRRYYQEVTRPFHISMASMDLSACTLEPVQLMVQFQKRNYLLCTLLKSGPHQVPLDLNFEIGDEVSFTINGQSHVHLSGYHLEEEMDDEEEDGEEEAESDFEEVIIKKDDLKTEKQEEVEEEAELSLGNIVYGKRKQSKISSTNVTPAAKRSRTLQLLADAAANGSDDDEDDEDVTFSDLDDDDSDEADTTLDTVDDDDLVEDSDDDDDDRDLEEAEDEEDEAGEEEAGDEQEEDEEDSEEEMEKQVVQKKLSKKEKNKTKQLEKETQQQKQTQQPKQAQQQKQTQQQKHTQQQTPEKQKKHPNKKNEGAQPQQQPQANGTPTSEKKKKKKNKNKQGLNESLAKDANVSGKENNQKSPKSEKKQQNQQISLKKTFVDRGVTIEEVVVGTGNPAKNGKLAHVFYDGRLKNNKKSFDNCLKGRPPFRFRLGNSEVIKGWDIGVAGMKIGGKRRITVPAHLAYGSKGNQPAIPPNATLVFDIELANVS